MMKSDNGSVLYSNSQEVVGDVTRSEAGVARCASVDVAITIEIKFKLTF
jgi:hypothetical protein